MRAPLAQLQLPGALTAFARHYRVVDFPFSRDGNVFMSHNEEVSHHFWYPICRSSDLQINGASATFRTRPASASRGE